MVNYGSILIPLYIYPYPPTTWQPLINAAKAYPAVNFTAVINPDNGPAPVAGGCPNSDYVAGLASLNALPNVNTMGYVHTANRYNCGSSHTDICPCTQPYSAITQNITTYANWAKLSCKGYSSTPQDVHIDSIFVDEAPGQDGGANLTYMTNVTNFARQSGFNASNGHNGIVLFNPGSATDLSYFKVADQIVILEDTQANYEAIPNIDTRNGNGQYYYKSAMIIYSFSTAASQINSDTTTILSLAQDAFPSLYITNLPNSTQTNQYGAFGSNWGTFVSAVNSTVYANRAYCKSNGC